MPVLMFQPWKARKVESGESRQTVRPERKNPILPGDDLSLREWTGKPYRSKQKVLREEICHSTRPVEIDVGAALYIGGNLCSEAMRNLFAREDGFDDYNAMLAWFEKNHSLPFTGVCIKW